MLSDPITCGVRNLPDETHRALKLRAAQHGRSAEAEALTRHTLESAVRPAFGMGSALAAIGRSLGGFALDLQRDSSPVRPAQFE